MLLLLDNYDSFTYNLAQLFGELGVEVKVVRNDAITLEEVEALRPRRIVISPGPGTPDGAGIALPLVQRFAGRLPLFGVCLGHQTIGQAFGGRVIRAATVMHGKASPVLHDGTGLFAGLPEPLEVIRYHSLVVESATLPSCLQVTARTPEGEIMALAHRSLPVWGVQFHPESVFTPQGKALLANFLAQPWQP